MKTLLVSTIVALGFALPAHAGEIMIDRPYNFEPMQGCYAKPDADMVVAMADLEGSGGAVWEGLGMSNKCVFTFGTVRIKQVYRSFEDSRYDGPVWYVRYEHQMFDGSWLTFYGFTMEEPVQPRCDTCI